MTATEESPVETVVRNLRVIGVAVFGASKRGRVVPKWFAELSGHTAEALVAAGTLEWTDDPVAPEDADRFEAPAPRGAEPDATTVAMQEELNRLRRLTVEVKDQNRVLAGQNEELRATNGRHLKALGEQTAEIARLKALADGHALAVRDLTAELERRPPIEAKPEAAPQDVKADAAAKALRAVKATRQDKGAAPEPTK